MTSAKNAIVIGGSLGGLFTGIVLKRLGYTVTILERSPTPLLHDQGAGIVVGGETMAFIYHFEKTNRAMGIRSPLRHYLNRQGEEIERQEYTQRMTSWDLMYYVLRANFDNVTSAYVLSAEDPGDVKYEYGCTVTGIEEEGEQMVVTYDSTRESGPQKISAPRVFAADGPSSTIRRLLLPNVERTYAGYVRSMVFAINRVGCVAGDGF
jgi:2-polyprenyl-6-methoxyphenol hydroxylase-like FAD-dependent oxidoreductase